MNLFPSLIPLFALLATGCGLWGIAGFVWSMCPHRANRSRWVFLAMFLLMASACLAAAITWHRGVLPFGLAVAALFLAFLWPYSTTTVERAK